MTHTRGYIIAPTKLKKRLPGAAHALLRAKLLEYDDNLDLHFVRPPHTDVAEQFWVDAPAHYAQLDADGRLSQRIRHLVINPVLWGFGFTEDGHGVPK